MIDGPTNGGDLYRLLEERNAAAIAAIPDDDNWPWLIRSHFTLPDRTPEQKYRSQVIHFGLSLKDDPPRCDSSEYDADEGWPADHRECVTGWIVKFENLLRTLYWFGANVHIETEFEQDRLFRYTPTQDAIDKMVADEPQPIAAWDMTVIRTSEQAT